MIRSGSVPRMRTSFFLRWRHGSECAAMDALLQLKGLTKRSRREGFRRRVKRLSAALWRWWGKRRRKSTMMKVINRHLYARCGIVVKWLVKRPPFNGSNRPRKPDRHYSSGESNLIPQLTIAGKISSPGREFVNRFGKIDWKDVCRSRPSL